MHRFARQFASTGTPTSVIRNICSRKRSTGLKARWRLPAALQADPNLPEHVPVTPPDKIKNPFG